MGKGAEYETLIRLREGRSAFFRITLSRLGDSHGENSGAVLTLQDITRMKTLEDQSSRTGRMAAMGKLAAQIAHEIRNPLGSIELFASVLGEHLGEHEEYGDLTRHISRGVRSIDNIITNLLMFVKEQQPEFRNLDIHETLDDSKFFSAHLTGSEKGVEVRRAYAGEPVIVRGDRELLKQVFLNLILNAIQAMPEGGSLMITTRRGDAAQGNCAEIEFADTGVGIPDSELPRIFDPFFTTKRKGTGLGLSIVHNIISQHMGTIHVRSCEGKGTAFVVTLPLVKVEKDE
jgi:signal transduction histidine kinase